MKLPKKLLVVGIILCASLVTLTGAFAAYTTQIEGKAVAHVARFSFDATVTPQTNKSVMATAPGEVKIGTVRVTNQIQGAVCEVRTKYSVTLRTANALPDGVILELRRGGLAYSPTQSNSTEFQFEDNSFVFEPGKGGAIDYDVVLRWPVALNSTSDVLVTASVTAEQVD